MKIFIQIPCYNEENTILDIVNKVILNINQKDEISSYEQFLLLP